MDVRQRRRLRRRQIGLQESAADRKSLQTRTLPKRVLLLLLLVHRQEQTGDAERMRPAATRHWAWLWALLAAILDLGSHLMAGGLSRHCHNAATTSPQQAQLSSRTKGRNTGSLDLDSQAGEPALEPGRLPPGPCRSVLASAFTIPACAMKGREGEAIRRPGNTGAFQKGS